MFNVWAKIFLAFIFYSFLYPAMVIFNVENIKIVFLVYKIVLFCFIFAFLLYPFIKSYQAFSRKEKIKALGFLVMGIIMPVIFGMFSCFLIELMINSRKNKIGKE